MIELLAVGAVTAGLAVWICKPFFERRGSFAPRVDRKLEELLEAKDAIYRTILDLELDHKTRKISDSQYLNERAQAEAEALALLAQIDSSASTVDSLELEIAAARRRLLDGS